MALHLILSPGEQAKTRQLSHFFDKFMDALQCPSVDLPACMSPQLSADASLSLDLLCVRVCGQLPLVSGQAPRVLEPSVTRFPSLPPLLTVGAALIDGSGVLCLNRCISSLLKHQRLPGWRPHHVPPCADLVI